MVERSMKYLLCLATILAAAGILAAQAPNNIATKTDAEIEGFFKDLKRDLAKEQSDTANPPKPSIESLFADEQDLNAEEEESEQSDHEVVTQDEEKVMKDIELQIQGLEDSAKVQSYYRWYRYYYALYCRWRGYYYRLLRCYKTYRRLYIKYRNLYYRCVHRKHG